MGVSVAGGCPLTPVSSRPSLLPTSFIPALSPSHVLASYITLHSSFLPSFLSIHIPHSHPKGPCTAQPCAFPAPSLSFPAPASPCTYPSADRPVSVLQILCRSPISIRAHSEALVCSPTPPQPSQDIPSAAATRTHSLLNHIPPLYYRQHGHELPPLPLRCTHLRVLQVQDAPRHHPLHDLPSASANSPYSSLSRRNAHHSHRSQAFNGQHGRAYLFDGVCVQIPHILPKLSAYPALFHARALVPMTASAHAIFGNLCSATLLRSSLLAFLLSPLPQCERDRG